MAQIVSITLGTPPAGVTAFNLRYLPLGGTWTDYFTTGSTLEDLPIADLTAGVYLLDGVNGATGDAAAASAEGVLYQARWKSAAGYGNWSPIPFAAGSGPVDAVWVPAWQAARQKLYFGSKAVPADDPLVEYGLAYELPRVIEYLEGPFGREKGAGGCGRRFTPGTGPRKFRSCGGTELQLRGLDGRIADLVHPSHSGTTLTILGNGTPLAGVEVDDPQGLPPWNRLWIPYLGGNLATFPVGTVEVQGATWGYAATPPQAIIGAVAAEVVALVLVGRYGPLTGLGTLVSMEDLSVSTAAGVSIWPITSPIGVNGTIFMNVVEAYREPRARDEVPFGPRIAKALWG